MVLEHLAKAVELGYMPLLKRLVSEELDRRIAVLDDIVSGGYGDYIGKRAESNQEALKAAILELVRSPLASLERSLACIKVEPEPEPEEVPAVEAEAEAEA